MTTITVHADKPGAKINPQMWGLFFEDINFGADGGLYAELVKNRSFSFPSPLTGWQKISPSKARGAISVLSDDAYGVHHPQYLRVQSQGTDVFGVANEGFRGMGMKAGEAYDLTLRIRCVSGTPTLRVVVYAENGTVLATVELNDLGAGWETRQAVLTPAATEAKAKLYLLMVGAGAIDIDLVSLFPRNTWKGRPGGLRADMVQALSDMKPGFLRFPGGCIVEGSELDKRYQWKQTIGPVFERPLLINRWNYEFLHRPAPDYFQSFGLGFFEYFLLCEDIGAAPLPIINCGMACQFNSCELVPTEELEPYIQDALDLIEFANGDKTTTWGRRRAELGHPEPFGLTTLGIGNEQWGPQYIERLDLFVKAIKSAYPDIQLIASCGPEPADERFRYLWPEFRRLNLDIVDEHCYARPSWFFENTHRYDAYDRNGPKVFFGEYAAQSDKMVSPDNVNNLECALSEAAFMIGLERNGDVVRLASYAPLFAHRDAWQWTPDLIWVDNLAVVPTANYYVQQLFSHHRGDETVPVDTDCASTTFFAGAVRDEARGEIVVKVVNAAAVPVVAQLALSAAVGSEAVEVVLAGQPSDRNAFDAPNAVKPVTRTVKIPDSHFAHRFAPWSLTILRLKLA